MASSTPSPGRPVAPPRMRGAMKLPSTCCTTKMMMANSAAFQGDSSSRMTMPGTAPRNGPSTGTMFVTPTSTASNGAYSSPKIDMRAKVSPPTSRASTSCPPR